MWRPDKGTWRTVRQVSVLTVVFLIVNTQVAHAAPSGSSGDLLSPLNITTSEGVPINGYELKADGGSLVDFSAQFCAMALSGIFTIIQVLVGLGCWAIEFAFRFPLISMLAEPAQQISDVYNDIVVDTLGLKGLMLAWAFVFGLILFVRGKAGKGLGEIALTLVIAAFAASMFVRPDYLLAENGPLAQTQQAAAEVAHTAVGNYNWGGHITAEELDECSSSSGAAEQSCEQRRGDEKIMPSEVARPIQDATTNALVVKPYMLLQYGRILDPAKKSDRKAYALHLKWVIGGYDKEKYQKGDNPCDLIKGPAREYCENGNAKNGSPKLPELTPGGELLDVVSPVVSDEDAQFQVFLEDLEKAGDVGKAAAAYAKQPDWWRVGSALLLLFAVLMITAILLSSAMTLLGAEGADVGAATIGGVTMVWGMLPGPNRQVVWKWLALFAISVAGMFAVCMFLPLFGMAIDTALTDGPDLVAERILLLDVLAALGLVFHRWIMQRISQMGRSMAVRMRFAKVGGTHLPGDTSEIGAALAMNGAGAGGGFGYGGGLRGLAFGGGYGGLGTRHRLMGHLGAMTDGAGMPFDPQRMLGAGMTEAGRGLAPLGLASVGARLGMRGAWGLVVGKHPGAEALEKWRKPTAEGDPNGVAGGYDGLRRGPQDRYRDADGRITGRDDRTLHDQNSDRTLLSTRAHNRLVRLRGYRILHRGGRVAYGSTIGLASNIRRGRGHAQDLRSDARQQWNVWRNTVQQDGHAWSDSTVGATRRHIAEHGADHGGDGPFTRRRLSAPSSRSGSSSSSSGGRSEPGTPANWPLPPGPWPPRNPGNPGPEGGPGSAPRRPPVRPSGSGGSAGSGLRSPSARSREEAREMIRRISRNSERRTNGDDS